MRALVMSDIHGDDFTLRWMLEQAWKFTGPVDAYICLGDGAHDFQRLESFIRRHDEHALMYCVRGNCDFTAGDLPERMIIAFGGANIFLTHGHYYHVKSTLSSLRDAAQEANCSIALYGHTHRADVDTSGPLLINPGAAKDGRLALLAVSNGKPLVKLLEF